MAGGRRIRTDLALETTERFAQENTEIRGVEIQEAYDEEKDIRTTVVKIVTENGAKSMGRPQGTYITIEAPDLSNADEDYHREISQEISRHLRELINLEKEKSILVVGLGNAAITADALGPHVIENLHMTRHLIREYGLRGIGQEKMHCVIGIIQLWHRQGWRLRRLCRALFQRQNRMWWLRLMHSQHGVYGG